MTIKDKEVLKINFEDGDYVALSLDPTNPNIAGEIAMFTDVDKNWYIFD